MKSIVTLLCSALLGVSLVASAGESTPDTLVKSVTDDVMNVIRTTKDKRQLRETAEQKVLPNFDFKAMTQLAVGRYWREATPAQQKSLEDAFRTLLVNTYTSALSVSATGQESIEVKPSESKGNEAVVRTVVRSPSKQPVAVDYRMSNGENGWKVYDVIVENLSLVTNYRGTFASEIQKSGIDGLVKTLQNKNREVAASG